MSMDDYIAASDYKIPETADDELGVPRRPIHAQIEPKKDVEIHWGVHFLHEDVITDFGPGDEAKAAAKESVRSWADTDAPAKLVSQVVLPWSSDTNSFVTVVVAIIDARTDPRGVMDLREWLVEEGYETETNRRTGLSSQVPLIKKIRKSGSVDRGLELLHIWMATNGYQSGENLPPNECKHYTIERISGRCANPSCREMIAFPDPDGSDEAVQALRDRLRTDDEREQEHGKGRRIVGHP